MVFVRLGPTTRVAVGRGGAAGVLAEVDAAARYDAAARHAASLYQPGFHSRRSDAGDPAVQAWCDACDRADQLFKAAAAIRGDRGMRVLCRTPP